MMNDNNPSKAPPVRSMSSSDFAAWGMPELAFVKRDGESWSIHAADGTQMGLAPNRDLAFAAIRQHDLEPVSVH
jgi:hypothetical protein